MENTTNEVLERERRKRIQMREYTFEFSSNVRRVATRMETNIDRAARIIKKDWRTK